jgi:response regulator RpfG family c-di-GMP phosphodiesterase
MNIVIVDDNSTNLVLMATLAKTVEGAQIRTYEDPGLALEETLRMGADLVIIDYMMPGLDGIVFIEQLRQRREFTDVPVVMVTAAGDRSVRRRALEAGATDFLNKPVDTIEMRLRMSNLTQLRQARNLLNDRAALLALEVQQATAALRAGALELVTRLAQAAEFRDPETGGHIQRMARYSVVIGRALGMPPPYLDDLLTAAPLHDLGKVGIPDAVLLKPGKLESDELVIMRTHAEIGARLLSGSDNPLIQMACEIAGAHHEKWDGSGYPRGLSGEDIPLSGRIVAVADVLDALTSVRPYKRAWSFDEARAFIVEGKGRHFCPRCVDALLDNWDEIQRVHAAFPD